MFCSGRMSGDIAHLRPQRELPLIGSLRLAEHEVQVGAARTEGWVAGQVELLARIEPAVLAAHDTGAESTVEQGGASTLPFGVVISTQSPLAMPPSAGRMQLTLDRGTSAQAATCGAASRRSADLRAGEYERELVGEVEPRTAGSTPVR